MDLEIVVRRATSDEQNIVDNLLQLYMYEFSANQSTELNSDGRYDWGGLEDYWNDKSLSPFLVFVEGRIAGFALIQGCSIITGQSDVWDMEDFFILAKYRRRGVGLRVANDLMRQFRGQWEIRVLKGNSAALNFWRRAIARLCRKEIKSKPTLVGGREFEVFRFESA